MGQFDTNIYEAATAQLVCAVEACATQLNVAVTPNICQAIADDVLGTIDLPDVIAIAAVAPGAPLNQAFGEICRLLNVINLYRVAKLIESLLPDNARSSAVVEKHISWVVHEALPGVEGRRWPDLEALARLAIVFNLSGPVSHTHDDGTVVTRYWQRGAEHRDADEGPAVIEIGPRGRREVYWCEGVEHRSAAAGPAVVETSPDGTRILEIYLEHGKRHRDPAAGPAFMKRENRDGAIRLIEEYHWRGQVHRPSTEGPAIVETDEAGIALLTLYIENGELHRDPREGPARIAADPAWGQVIHEYLVGGIPRPYTEGPGLLAFDLDGRLVQKMYFQGQNLHRPASDGPALIYYGANGQPVSEIFYEDGMIHRNPNDGPACIHYDPESSVVVTEEYWSFGENLADTVSGATNVIPFSSAYRST